MKKQIWSIIFNGFISILTCYGIISWIFLGDYSLEQRIQAMRFFTLDSNLLCGISSIAMVIAGVISLCKKKRIPQWVLVARYAGTSAIGLTFFVVLFLLFPIQGIKAYSGANLIMHLVMPLLAMISFICFECPGNFSWKWISLAFVPCFIYGIVYLIMVVMVPSSIRWNDMYYFNHNGMWYLTMPAVYASGLLVSFLVLFAGKKINR